jgi:SOS-response transcriptional repressor LexA
MPLMELAITPYTSSNPVMLNLGYIGAGYPFPTDDFTPDFLTFDDMLILNPSATHLLEMPEDTMIGAGIMPGDTLIIDTSLTPRAGDIVVACIDDEWTVCYFRRDDKRRIYLEAANAKYGPLYPMESLTIHSVVVSTLRRYRA